MTIDIDAIRAEWLRHCGLCDAGLLTECTCPKGDVRSLVSALCNEVEQTRAKVDELTAEREHMELNPTGTADWLKNRVAELTAERDFARDMANTARAGAADAIRALDHARPVVEATVHYVNCSDEEAGTGEPYMALVHAVRVHERQAEKAEVAS